MPRRLCCGMAVGMLLGICAAAYGTIAPGGMPAIGMTAFGGLLAAGAALIRQKRKKAAKLLPKQRIRNTIYILFISIMVVLGWQHYRERESFRQQYLALLEEGMQLLVQGELAKKTIQDGRYVYELTSCLILSKQKQNSNTHPVACDRILVYSDADAASIGETLILNGKIELWREARNEGSFDEQAFYRARGVAFRMWNPQIEQVHGEKKHLSEQLFWLRTQIASVYAECMGEAQAGIMAMMVVGEKSLLHKEVEKLYRICGLSHILAISGLHISVIGMSLYQLLRRGGCGLVFSSLLAAGVMCGYGVMVGGGISVKRAVAMFLLMLVAQVIGRSYDSLNALGIAAIFLLWENPNIFLDAGFQLSFAAVIGIVWVGHRNIEGHAPKQEEGEEKAKKWERVGEFFSKNILGSLAIQLMTLPIVTWYYYEVPMYAVLINLVVLLWTEKLLFLGILGGLVGVFSTEAARIVLLPCQLLLSCNLRICEMVSGLPGAMLITGKPTFWKIFLYYTGIGLLTFYRHTHTRRQKKFGGFSLGLSCAAIECILLVWLLWRPAAGFELCVLDVGQGDGSFLRTEQGVTVFLDGGSSDVRQVGTYRILPFLKAKGIRKVDFWFVSHTDQDHISGLLEILEEGYSVGQLVFSAGMQKDKRYEALKNLADKEGTKLLFVREGDVLHLGDGKMRVLSPKRGMHYQDKNTASLVLLYEEEDFAGMFTGDIDARAEGYLLDGWTHPVDFYKAAHHGSKYSNSEEFLKVLSPTVCIVSCGKNNSYGHPAAEAIAHMEGAGATVFYTMHSGQLTLRKDKGRLVLKEYCPLAKSREAVLK
ncbi:MAG: DNA internalization-related competence protein ComEC/Rec2 [Clostridiales bacterium]|nr:DNA internalization-related competence protein ComEC/Rec2 [Clostridiales bacterium]